MVSVRIAALFLNSSARQCETMSVFAGACSKIEFYLHEAHAHLTPTSHTHTPQTQAHIHHTRTHTHTCTSTSPIPHTHTHIHHTHTHTNTHKHTHIHARPHHPYRKHRHIIITHRLTSAHTHTHTHTQCVSTFRLHHNIPTQAVIGFLSLPTQSIRAGHFWVRGDTHVQMCTQAHTLKMLTHTQMHTHR